MKIRDLCHIAIFTSIICICSWISVPFIIPFTLQTMGVFLAILILGEKKGIISIVLYLLIGLIGVPVFSGFRGGIGAFFGPTGGFLIGFIFIDLTYWLTIYLFGKKPLFIFLGLISGLIICYILGTAFYFFVYDKISILSVLSICVFPFVLPDLLKLLFSMLLYRRIKNDEYISKQ